MHSSAIINAKAFFDTYGPSLNGATAIDIGAQDVNGSLRQVCPESIKYIGVDFVEGRGVDIVLTDPYKLPFESESIDVVVSNSCLEHSEFFWVAFMEMLRVLKPHGLVYLNVPSNGDFHRYPVDCWRFYPDAGTALVNWARRNGVNVALLESCTTPQRAEPWNDFISVFVKDEAHSSSYPKRMIETLEHFSNGYVYGSTKPIRPRKRTQDQSNLSFRLKRLGWRIKGKLGITA